MKTSKITLNIVIVTMLVLTALVGLGSAALVPPPPPPVPQHIGLPDTSVLTLITTTTDQSACRSCHLTVGTNLSGILNGSTYNNTAVGGVPSRHHSLVARHIVNPNTSVPFACVDCHPSTPGVGNGIYLDRSCLECHNGKNQYSGNALGGHVGNITRPHHVNTSYASSKIGNPAANRTCDFCHGAVVNNYNDKHYKPSYDTSFMITPYAFFKTTDTATPDGLGGNKTWGGCYSCHLADPSATPQPIGANEPNHHDSINSGSLIDISMAPSPGRICFVCHVIDPSNPRSPYRFNITNDLTGETLIRTMEFRNSTIEAMDAANNSFENGTTNITINGTGCEKCHGVSSLHNIQYQYQANGPQGLGHINNNLDCSGCHDSWLPATDFVPGALVPTVTDVSPSVVAADTPTTLTIAGNNFVNEPYTSVVKVDGVAYTPSSITESQIVVDIPALSVGTHQLQILKGTDSLSNLETLTVMSKVVISSATFDGATVTISGAGFGDKPATNAEQYVLVGSVGYSASIISWTDSKIVATVSGAVAAGDNVEVMTANGGQVAATVTISAAKDTTPPVITLNGVSPVTVALNSVYTDAGATATDNVDTSVAVVTTSNVNTKLVGTYTVTYTATDNAGNSATATRSVIVAKPALAKITVTPSSAQLAKRGKQVFTATAVDQFGKAMPNIAIAWSSSNTNVGTVSPSSVKTNTKGQATTTFTASSRNTGAAIVTAKNLAISGTATVTVK